LNRAALSVDDIQARCSRCLLDLDDHPWAGGYLRQNCPLVGPFKKDINVIGSGLSAGDGVNVERVARGGLLAGMNGDDDLLLPVCGLGNIACDARIRREGAVEVASPLLL